MPYAACIFSECLAYSWLDKLTRYSTSVVQWFHRRLWAPLVVYWRKYIRVLRGKQIFWPKYSYSSKNMTFYEKLKRAFLLGIKFPFMRVQMENMIFYRLPLAYWEGIQCYHYCMIKVVLFEFFVILNKYSCRPVSWEMISWKWVLLAS